MISKGFTLIELMIVVAIIGILAMFALPAYQDYTRRAHVAEGMTLASSAKVAVVETYAVRGSYPTSNSLAGLVAPSKIAGNAVDTITVGDVGIITIAYNSRVGAAGSNTIILTPTPAPIPGEAIKWDCKLGSVNVKFRTADCRN